jgi:hypothetical protein
MGTKVIAVRVGPEPDHTDFTVHEQLIRASSEFFEAALSREWRESQERVVRLPTCDKDAFRLYNQWPYSGRLHAIPTGPSRIDAESSNLIQGFLLGDYLQDCNYKDNTIGALVEWQKRADDERISRFFCSWVTAFEQQLHRQDPLRRVLVDMIVYRGSHHWWVTAVTKVPALLVQDLSVCLSQRCKVPKNPSASLVASSGCWYHSHGAKPSYAVETK